jgi:hypothetical protein
MSSVFNQSSVLSGTSLFLYQNEEENVQTLINTSLQPYITTQQATNIFVNKTNFDASINQIVGEISILDNSLNNEIIKNNNQDISINNLQQQITAVDNSLNAIKVNIDASINQIVGEISILDNSLNNEIIRNNNQDVSINNLQQNVNDLSSNKVNKSGDTMTGDLILGGSSMLGIGKTPAFALDVLGSALITGNTVIAGSAIITANLSVTGTVAGATPTANNHLTTKLYVDNSLNAIKVNIDASINQIVGTISILDASLNNEIIKNNNQDISINNLQQNKVNKNDDTATNLQINGLYKNGKNCFQKRIQVNNQNLPIRYRFNIGSPTNHVTLLVEGFIQSMGGNSAGRHYVYFKAYRNILSTSVNFDFIQLIKTNNNALLRVEYNAVTTTTGHLDILYDPIDPFQDTANTTAEFLVSSNQTNTTISFDSFETNSITFTEDINILTNTLTLNNIVATGNVTGATPTLNNHLATKEYVDTQIANIANLFKTTSAQFFESTTITYGTTATIIRDTQRDIPSWVGVNMTFRYKVTFMASPSGATDTTFELLTRHNQTSTFTSRAIYDTTNGAVCIVFAGELTREASNQTSIFYRLRAKSQSGTNTIIDRSLLIENFI